MFKFSTNFKKNFVSIFSTFIIILCIFSISGCQSNRNAITEGDITESIIGNQRADAKLEVISTDLTELHRSSISRVETIREQSKRIGDITDRLIYLFGAYESEVNRLLNEVDRIRNEAKTKNEDSNDIREYTSSDDTH